jgi:hypothetical protein
MCSDNFNLAREPKTQAFYDEFIDDIENEDGIVDFTTRSICE